MNQQKSQAKILKDQLFLNKKNASIIMTDEEINSADAFCEEYKNFLNKSKTERESVLYAKEALEKNNFKEYRYGMPLTPGDKIYVNNRGKAVIIAVIGKQHIENGINICAAHIDSPRLDLKPYPLYEANDLALFKTHYYGGIKKYQWTALPLSLHGIIVKADKSTVDVNIGEDEGDPVFCVTDLLPHLASEQMKRTFSEGIKGEELNILIGSRAFRLSKEDKESEIIKLNIMHALNQKYGITEEDFCSAEIEAVPAFKARDIGFDRSLIGAYGHDDRICAYASLQAILQCCAPNKTCIAVLTDKEETGSDGNTGLKSAYLKYFVRDLAKQLSGEAHTVFSNSRCLSADVNAAFDPTFPDVLEKNNSAYINHGVVLTKYTGSKGKANTSDTSAEFFGEIRHLLNSNNIIWQTGELGKVDMGGGGTVASYIANLNVDTVDIGIPVLSMHSPFEVVSKLDVYMAFKAINAFFI